jgi:predicted cupin superfamily sugar epimerase
MHPRAQALVRSLGLVTHPEGGFYRELFRSPHDVEPEDGRGTRSALTLIAFLLVEGSPSRWHRVRSDECWHWIEGAALELRVANPHLERVTPVRLGADEEALPIHLVPAGHWQAARALGPYALVTCAVAPGFDFADFTLMRDERQTSDALRVRHPHEAGLL